ncbi:hypothetical protein EYR41_004043 [Orbilia oligospora]|uniref:Large ribosomal subunit protein uL23m n=1 Tax=Orbilia oligospora TaxID=2813651 RepID=A0A8H2E7H2_ORBOL|nr:hypothetical protein EYR41_004043 [Orbilia oligospora]
MKPVYLPNFVIALVRTPRLPPTFAQFAVPLSLNKLDLKNYLKNAYGIKVLGVRSSIRQQPVEIEQQGGARRYVRKQAEKRMIIEMEEPFVWPEEPQDLTKFDNQLYKNIEKFREDMREKGMDGKRNRLAESKTRRRLSLAVQEMRNGQAEVPSEEAPREELTDLDFATAAGEGQNKS